MHVHYAYKKIHLCICVQVNEQLLSLKTISDSLCEAYKTVVQSLHIDTLSLLVLFVHLFNTLMYLKCLLYVLYSKFSKYISHTLFCLL